MEFSSSSLQCSVAIQSTVLNSRATSKAESCKTAEVVLGRDGFEEPILRIRHGRICHHFSLTHLQIHRRFLKEGKATLHFEDKKVQVLISNCPPNRLLHFLKTIVAKRAKYRVHSTTSRVSARDRLFNLANQVPFTEISPLCEADVVYVNGVLSERDANRPGVTSIGRKVGRGLNQNDTTPCGKPDGAGAVSVKRKLSAEGDAKSDAKRVEPRDDAQEEKRVRRCISLPRSLSDLNADQRAVLHAVLAGRSVFFTGSAGTGKSFLLHRLIGSLAPEHTFVTASTGIAAAHISGMTLHSFAGIGSGTSDLSRCVELASRKVVAAQWRRCKHLIVDEISMVDGHMFSKLEAVARVVRKNDKPFGGIQLVICGDFLQLPPIRKSAQDTDAAQLKLAFETSAWRKSIQQTIILSEVKRQTDKSFISVLQEVRRGRCPEFVCSALRSTWSNKLDGPIIPTRLSTHNQHVASINEEALDSLPGDPVLYRADDSDPSLFKHIDNLCPVSRTVSLKLGAQVMIVKNISVKDGLVNGSRGVVESFNSSKIPTIRLVNGKSQEISPQTFSFKWSGGLKLMRKQLPLKLAWAVSIHKSQGMTLDLVEISLARVFEAGQAYVALSRARSLNGLRVIDFTPECIRANPRVLEYYDRLEHAATSRE